VVEAAPVGAAEVGGAVEVEALAVPGADVGTSVVGTEGVRASGDDAPPLQPAAAATITHAATTADR
jgi:hypothetical protein